VTGPGGDSDDWRPAARDAISEALAGWQAAAPAQVEIPFKPARVVLDSLRQRGVLTLDVPANQLSMSVINRYLELHAERIEEQAAEQRAVLARVRDYLLASCEAIGA